MSNVISMTDFKSKQATPCSSKITKDVIFTRSPELLKLQESLNKIKVIMRDLQEMSKNVK